MFTTDVINAIGDTIYNVMNDDEKHPKYTLYMRRVPQCLKTPCFIVKDIKDTLIDRISNGFNVRSLFNVIYFPESEIPDMEFNEMLDKLMPWLNIVKTEDGTSAYRTMGLEAEKGEDLVTIQFAVTYDCKRVEDIPLMEALWLKQRTTKFTQ